MNSNANTLPLSQRQGITSFSLKVLALLFMTLDHIHYFLGGSLLPVPELFGMLGRLSAPLFLFTMAEGFSHTRNRKAYLTRLYAASVLMSLGNFLINRYLPHPGGAMVINSMFSTLFLTGLFLQALETGLMAIRERSFKKLGLSVLLLGTPFLSGVLVFLLIAAGSMQTAAGKFLFNFLFMCLPSPFFAEGGFIWIFLGMGFYFLRNRKGLLSGFYLLLSGYFFFTAAQSGLTFENLFLSHNQWLMVFSLIFILLYRGRKGASMKYFFYLYYPLHIYALVLLARLLAAVL